MWPQNEQNELFKIHLLLVSFHLDIWIFVTYFIRFSYCLEAYLLFFYLKADVWICHVTVVWHLLIEKYKLNMKEPLLMESFTLIND